jgi:tetratricopeptide (TPR) repeat protein
MKNLKISPGYLLAALLSVAFTLALSLDGQLSSLSMSGKSDNLFGMLLGDGRKLFANQFFTMADVYFHSGYYPSIFDENAEEEKDIVTASHGKKETEEEEKGEDFLGKPKDWIDAFGRNFRVIHHTHLENGHEREILPWLRLAADLDPQKVDTYTVGAFFLWEHLGRADQAEAFLREGLRNNPDSCEILFELGRLYWQGNNDANRARNVWQLGVKKFLARSPEEEKETRLVYEEIVVNLAEMEAQTGNYNQAINWFHAGQQVSPDPAALQRQIDAIQKKMSAGH